MSFSLEKLTRRDMKLQGDWLAGYWELGEFLTKIENILTHWSVAQVGSNYEKKKFENLAELSL